MTQWRIADGGIETALEERLEQELPEFAAFVLLNTAEGKDALREYYRPFAQLAKERNIPLTLDTPTWRTSAHWLNLLGFSETDHERFARDAVALVREVAEAQGVSGSLTVGGVVGPKNDEYVAEERMSA